jgi:hypothetical protein
MTRLLRRVALAAALAALGPAAIASPDLTALIQAGPLRVAADDRREGLYYFLPGELRLDSDPEGEPGLHLLQLRYLGTRAAGDQGAEVFRSLLSVRVIMDGPQPSAVEEARQALAARSPRGQAELRPLPVARIEAALVYAPLGKPESVLPTGYFESGDGATEGRPGSYWRERTYTVRLEPHDAQLVWGALHEQQVVVSLGYAFFALGVASDTPLATLTGSPALVRELEDRLRRDEGASASAWAGEVPHLVKAGAASLGVDVSRWPGLLRRIDVNERLPPGYPLLDVYCYDFRDRLRPDLAVKRIEVEAMGVSGRAVVGHALFESAQPDLYAQGLRFPFAVRMDQPYRFRVTEIDQDGRVTRGEWRVATSWARLLDVTTPASGPEGPESGVTEEKH